MWGLRKGHIRAVDESVFSPKKSLSPIFFSPPSDIYYSGSRQSKLPWRLSGDTESSIFIFFVAQNTLSL